MRKPFKPKRRINTPKTCYFCVEKKDPDYKDLETAKRFVTDRGKIVSSLVSGICKKHQVRLSQAVKRARFLALLPYIVRPL